MEVLPVAVVTGANRGIGLEVVRRLAHRGHHAVLGSRDLAKGRAAAARTDPGTGRVTAVQLDVSDGASVAAMADRVTRELGCTDVIVNNAAILYDTWAQARTADLDEVQRALETNLFGAWRVTQALLPLLTRSPHPRVVNVSSEVGSLQSMTGGTPAYSVSKASLNALTRLLAGELRRHHVLSAPLEVRCIGCGYVVAGRAVPRAPSGRCRTAPDFAEAGVQITFSRTSAPSVNAPGTSGSQTVMIR